MITAPYHAAKDVAQGGVWIAKKTYAVAEGTRKIIYKIGEYTYEVVKAPIEWALTHEEIRSIDGLPVKEAIRQGPQDAIHPCSALTLILRHPLHRQCLAAGHIVPTASHTAVASHAWVGRLLVTEHHVSL